MLDFITIFNIGLLLHEGHFIEKNSHKKENAIKIKIVGLKKLCDES